MQRDKINNVIGEGLFKAIAGKVKKIRDMQQSESQTSSSFSFFIPPIIIPSQNPAGSTNKKQLLKSSLVSGSNSPFRFDLLNKLETTIPLSSPFPSSSSCDTDTPSPFPSDGPGTLSSPSSPSQAMTPSFFSEELSPFGFTPNLLCSLAAVMTPPFAASSSPLVLPSLPSLERTPEIKINKETENRNKKRKSRVEADAQGNVLKSKWLKTASPIPDSSIPPGDFKQDLSVPVFGVEKLEKGVESLADFPAFTEALAKEFVFSENLKHSGFSTSNNTMTLFGVSASVDTNMKLEEFFKEELLGTIFKN